MAKEFVWIRLGDDAEYEKYSSPHDAGVSVGNRLGMEEWEPMSYYFISAGVEIQPNFVGKNYVALFWGDKDAKWIKDLSQLEKNAFMDGIRKGALKREKTSIHAGGHLKSKMVVKMRKGGGPTKGEPDEPEELGDVWTDIRPVESINIDWFKQQGYSPNDVKMFLEGVEGIVPVRQNELEVYTVGQKVDGTPIYVEWSHPMTMFVDDEGFVHSSEGTTQTWTKETFVFVGDTFARGMFGIESMWVPEYSRWAEELLKK